MSKFNKTAKTENVSSYEGGKSYNKNSVEDLMNFMFSSYLENQFYETADEQTNRLIGLLDEVSEQLSFEWIAKLSFFTRKELGMKSVSHLAAGWLNSKTFENKRAYYRNSMKIPSDVAEVFSVVDMLGEKRSHALVRGAADYLSSLGEYQLGKYKMNGKQFNMHDLINITHAHSAAIDKYKADELETPDTWEVNISGAVDQVERDYHWRKMVEEGRLGYLALIRNLRNITKAEGIDQKWVNKYLVPQLTNETAIKKSMVFPYQIYCAYKNIGIRNMAINSALDYAFRVACGNMPEMDGRTLIMLDVSGSMEDKLSSNSSLMLKEVGAVYAAAMLVNTNADFVKFGTMAKKMEFNLLDNIFDIVAKMCSNDSCGWGTDIGPAFDLLDKQYDRIFLVSDMQIMNDKDIWWYRMPKGVDTYKDYCREYKCQPHMYSFDLANYSTQVENPNNPRIHLCTVLNDTLFKMIPYLEDGGSLVDYINNNFSYC